jgi:hypothetical protein
MVTTSWCSLTAFPRHGPIGAVLPRRGGFPAVKPRRHLLGAKRKTGFKKHLHGWIMWGQGGGQIPPQKCTPKCTPYVNMQLGT